ncbi:hypothetical protein FRACYDRAFT_272794, partial [Fragilariopsis cylindrus CCMP1102]
MIQHRTNLPFAIDAAPPLDHTITMPTTSSSPTSSATAFFGQHLRLDDSFDSIDTISSEFSLSSSSSSSTSFSLKQRKSTRRMKNHKHNFDQHPHHHYHHHHHHSNDFLFCGPNNENGGFLANTTSTPKQQQSTNMDLPPQHSSSGRPSIEFTLFVNKDNENNNNADNVMIIPERLLVPLL